MAGPSSVGTQLVFTSQPVSVDAGETIAPPVIVQIRDSHGTLVSDADGPVTIALGTNAAGASLAGTTTVTAAHGVATFDDLWLNQPGTAYTLVATSGTLTEATSSPFTISLIFLAVSAGADHSCSLNTGGLAYCWGSNAYGQLGDGTTTSRTKPVVVTGGLRFKSIVTGDYFTCGLTIAGAGYCWGYNFDGELGDSTKTGRTSPKAVVGGLVFSTLGPARGYTVCGTTTDAAAHCWGRDPLGDSTVTSRSAPVLVSGGLSFQSVATGYDHSCGVTTGGSAYCWGENLYGQIGDGTGVTRLTPKLVATSVSVGTVSAAEFDGCSVGSDHAGYCWGDDTDGEDGDNSTNVNRLSPVSVYGAVQFLSISTGDQFTCGLTTTRAAYCWGQNTNGQVGSGASGADMPSPVLVGGGLSFSSISAGGSHACGVSAGALYCWGLNASGQLGDGTTTNRAGPVKASP
ncbi:MAG: RCC1 domain-containing protein [Gemmatimonadaceae bacterium]